MTGEGLDHLLALLDADRDRAGERYVLLRRKLVAFFEWRGVSSPEECADQTLAIAARRLVEGEEVRTLPAYCVGIARMVLLEEHRRAERERAAFDEIASLAQAATPAQDETRFRLFEECLSALPPESRELILTYYRDDGQAKIDTRRELARQLGIPLNALRIRAHRIRVRLEESVNALAAARTGREKRSGGF